MIREEAINILKTLKQMMRRPDGTPISDGCEAIDMAIEALQAKTDGDLIRRSDVLGYISRLNGCGLGKVKSLEYIRKYIERLPSAEPKTGEWRGEHKMPDMPRYEWYRCSECSFLSQSVVNYCPNCGADMGGKER